MTRYSNSQGRCSFSPRRSASSIALTLALLLLFPPGIWANPHGEDVRAGEATFHRDGAALTVDQNSDRAIIHWQGFSIDADERTTFVQPGVDSAVLNRVTTGNPSALLGVLESNGKLFLVNPNGVVVGEGAHIDTGSFTASTLDIDDGEFLAAGDLTLRGGSQAAVENRGQITARDGDIVLVGRRVDNAGTLRAAKGDALLGAGSEVILKELGEERILVAPASEPSPGSDSIPDAEASAALANSGSIEAVRVRLEAAGGNPYALAIRNDGAVRATGAVATQGRIVLTGRGGDVANDGTLVARNPDGSGGDVRIDAGAAGTLWHAGSIDVTGAGRSADGGNATVYGERVALLADSSIDASGSGIGDGGLVLAGGDARDLGGDAVQPISDALHVAKTATVRARGGARGGYGGFVETSGAHLEIYNAPNAGAIVGGRAGEWLIDPYDLEVVAGGGSLNVTAFTSTGDDAELGVDLIESGLVTGNVTVQTGAGGLQAGRLTWSAALDYDGIGSTGRTLSVNAHDDILIEASLSQSGTGDDRLSIVLNADSDANGSGAIAINANIATGGGDLSILDGVFLRADLDTSTNQGGRAGGDLILAGAALLQDAGGIAIATTGPAGSGDVTFAGTVDSGNSYVLVDDVTRTWTDAFNNAKGVTAGGAAVGDTYLATITSAIENAALSSAANRTEVWLGGNDAAVEGVWRWVAGPEGTEAGGQGRQFWSGAAGGSAVDGQYTNWNVGEPNNGGGTEDYAQGGFGDEGRWNDLDHTATRNYVRETNIDPTALTIDAGTTGAVSFTSDVGSNKRLASLDVSAASLSTDAGADIRTVGDFSNSGVTLTTLRGDLTSTDGGITIARPTEVSGNLSLSALGTNADVVIDDDITNFGGIGAPLTIRANGNIALATNATIDSGSLTLIADTMELVPGNPIPQTGAIVAPLLELIGGSFSLANAGNDVDVLAGNAASILFRDDNGFSIGPVGVTQGVTTVGNLALQSSGTVTQSQAITAAGLALTGAGGSYSLNHGGNSFTTLAGDTGSLHIRGDSGFAIGTVDGTVGITTTGTTSLNSGGAMTQTQAIIAPSLRVIGGGSAVLDGNNEITTLAASSSSLSFSDATGFSIGSVDGTNGITTSGNTTLTSQGPVTQTQRIIASGLSLLGVGGTYVLTNPNNAIGTLAGNTNSIDFRAESDFSIGAVGATQGVTTVGNVALQTSSIVTQSQPIVSQGLALRGAGGRYTLMNVDNDTTNLAIDTNTVSLRDDSGFAIGVVASTIGATTAGDLTLHSAGEVTQSEAINAPGLELLGGTVGDFLLDGANNEISILATEIALLRFRDDTGFSIGTVRTTSGSTTVGNTTFSTLGAVTQTQPLAATGLSLLGLTGAYTLTNLGNAISTLVADTGSIDLRSNPDFSIGTIGASSGVTTTGNTILRSSGSISQSSAIVADGLGLDGGGFANLQHAGNEVDTLAANLDTLFFRDDDGYAIGTVGDLSGVAAGIARLQSLGAVTQTQAISGGALELIGGSFDLDDANNAIGNLAMSGSSLMFRNDAGFGIGTVNVTSGLTATGDITLTSTGAVSQTAAITAAGLSLLGTGGSFNLGSLGNSITTLAANTGSLDFLDNAGYTIGSVGSTNGLATTGFATLRSAGSVGQTQAITTPSLRLFGGSFVLGHEDNAVVALSAVGDDLAFRNDPAFVVGTNMLGIDIGGTTTLRSTGAVSQTESISSASLELVGGSFDFGGNTNNLVNTLAMSGSSLTFRDDDGLSVGEVGSTLGITTTGDTILTTTGPLTQTEGIEAAGLSLLGAGGAYTLTNANNAITTLAGDTGSVDFRENSGFAIGTVGGTSGLTTSSATTLRSLGTVTQTQPISASVLNLIGGSFELDDANNVATTLGMSGGSLAFRADDGFEIGNAGSVSGILATGDTVLTTTSAVTQSQPIDTGGLSLLGNGGNFDLTNLANTFTMLAGNTGSVDVYGSSGFSIGTVGETSGLTTSGETTLRSDGSVTQSEAVIASGLALLGLNADFTLANAGNATGTLSADADSLTFRADAGFNVGTVGLSTGITTSGNATLRSTGPVTQTDAISAAGLELVGGSFDFDDMNNFVTTLAMSGSTLAFRDDDGFVVGQVRDTSGFSASGDITLTSVGAVTQTQVISAAGLALLGVGGQYDFTHSPNAITTLAGNTGAVALFENSGFAIGSVGPTNGLTTTGDTYLLSPTGAVTQTQAISAAGLELAGATFDLGDANNDVTTLAATTGPLSFRDDNGFSIGQVGTTVGIATLGDTRLRSNGAVTQTASILTGGLALLGSNGSFSLTHPDNAITALAADTGTIDFRENSGFAIGIASGIAGVRTTGTTTLRSTGTVTQTQSIVAPTLELVGGTFDLDALSNAVTTLAMSGDALAFRDDTGLIVGTVGGTSGLTTTGNTVLTTTGTVTQLQAIEAAGLSLLGAGGAYTLTHPSNAITTLAGDTGSVDFRENSGFAIGSVEGTSGLTTTGNTTLRSAGAVSQTEAISAPGLELIGGHFLLDDVSNAVSTLAASGISLSFRDDAGFSIGTVGSTSGLTQGDSISLTSLGTVGQSQGIVAPSLRLLGTGGAYTLLHASNAITTLAGDTGAVAFRDDGGFEIGTFGATTGLTTSGNTQLTSIGAVSQSQAIAAAGLSLLGTAGTYELTHVDNAITTLAGNTGSVDFGENSGYAIGTVGATSGLTTTGTTTLRSTGTVTQTQTLVTPGLELVGGSFDLDAVSNAITTLAASGDALSFRDDTGFVIGTVGNTSGLATTGDTTLTTTGTVTQTQGIGAAGLSLLGEGGSYTLAHADNAVTSLSGDTGTVDFGENSGFSIGTVGATSGLTTNGNTTLRSTGSVGQSAAISATGLELVGGSFELDDANNAVSTLAVSGSALAFRDDTGFSIATVGGTSGITTSGNSVLSTTDAVSQTQAITAEGLSLLGAGGSYVLNHAGNALTTLAGNTGAVAFRDDAGFEIGSVGATTGLTTSADTRLTSTGAVTQSQQLSAAGLALLGTGGEYTLTNVDNAIATLAGNTGTVDFAEHSGYAIGTVGATSGLATTGNTTLRSLGAVTQSAAISAPGLELLGGSFDLDDASNSITTLAGSGEALSFRDDAGFVVGTVGATSGVTTTGNTALTTTSTVTQTEAIEAAGLSLLGTDGAHMLLHAGNAITTLAGNTGSVAFREDSGFAIGTVGATSGLVTSGNTALTTAGAVTQTQAIGAAGLALLGTGGAYTLTGANNAITTLAGDTSSIDLRADAGFAIGSVAGTVGVTTVGNLALQSSGPVTQSQRIVSQGLALRGTGGNYTLMNVANDTTNLAANTGTVSFRDDSGFAIGVVAGTVGVTTAGNLSLRSAGDVTQTTAVSAAGLELLGGSVGDFQLDGTNNTIGTLAAGIASLRLRADSGFTIGTVGGTSGVTTVGNTLLTTLGAVTQTQAISAPGLELLGGSYDLGDANNDVTTLAASTGALSFRDDDGFSIGEVGSTIGITTSGDTTLQSDGAVTQTAPILAAGLTLVGDTSGTFDLDDAPNDVDSLVAGTPSLSFRDDNGFVSAIAVGSVSGSASSSGNGAGKFAPARSEDAAPAASSPGAQTPDAGTRQPRVEPTWLCAPEDWARVACPRTSDTQTPVCALLLERRASGTPECAQMRREEGNEERAEAKPLPTAVELLPLPGSALELRARVAWHDAGAGSRPHRAE